MERDTLDLMWGGMNFVEILQLNIDKYILEYGTLPEDTFNTIMELLRNFSVEFFELLNEIDNHKEITLFRIKTLIDDRTKLIVQEAKMNPEKPHPTIVNHTIEIHTQEQPGEEELPNLEDLPGPQIENENPDDFLVDEVN